MTKAGRISLRVFELAVICGALVLETSIGNIGKTEAIEFAAGGLLGGLGVLGFGLLRRKAKLKIDPENSILKLTRIGFWFLAVTSLLYVIVAMLAILLGDYPGSISLAVTPLMLFLSGVAMMHFYSQLYRERVKIRALAGKDETAINRSNAQQLVFQRRAWLACMATILFALAGGVVSHFDQVRENAEAASKKVAVSALTNAATASISASDR